MVFRILLLVVNIVALVLVVMLYRRVRRSERERRVEAPNSAHTSPYLEDVESKERWNALDLERMHEVNRVEVERILGKLRATSIRALTTSERAFLDRMVEAERRSRRMWRPPDVTRPA